MSKERVLTNKEKALELMDRGFSYLDKVMCCAENLDNMARGRDLIRAAWRLIQMPEAPKPKTEPKPAAEVKNDG